MVLSVNNILFDFVEEMQFLKKYMKLQKESYLIYFRSSSVNEDLRSTSSLILTLILSRSMELMKIS